MSKITVLELDDCQYRVACEYGIGQVAHSQLLNGLAVEVDAVLNLGK